MKAQKISGGVVHQLPRDLREKLLAHLVSLKTWQDITPLARNEWICWITLPKKVETRNRRLNQAVENLAAGKRRPCCWAGCPHR